MGGDDDQVKELPSIAELLANPKRYQEAEPRPEPDATRPGAPGPTGRSAQGKGEAATAAGPDAAAVPPLDKLTPLPRPGDPYKAYARPANQPLTTLYVIRADGSRRGFPYSTLVEGPDLRPGAPGQGDRVVLRFSGSAIFDVTLAGLRLDELHIYLGDHRIRWVREWPKGRLAPPDGDLPQPLVARIEIERATDWPPGGEE